jgi:hypothetical protein
MPVISGIMFWKQRDGFAIAFALGWLGTNLFESATYAADAREMDLPLVTPGGGEAIHDWHYMLGELGMLEWDTTLGFLFRIAGTLSLLASLVGGAWILWRMARSADNSSAPLP